MKFRLDDFQQAASTKTISFLRVALGQKAAGQGSAIVLSSPTGSGKTVIATDVIEKVFYGDDALPPDPKAVFLWITDQPELNIQTRNKMCRATTKLTNDQLVIVETAFSQEKLVPGHVYFINTQKLGEGGLLIRGGDTQTYTFWQTVTNTVADPDIHLYGIVDEAHRGMVEARERAEAASIVQKFIKGSAELSALPIVIGMSATATRFQRVIAGTGRIELPVPVSSEEVRASGLIKERIVALCTDEGQPADMTMLREATKAWCNYVADWATYSYGPEETLVRPIFLVQVEDGNERRISATNLEAVINAIREEAGVELPDEAFAHAFDLDYFIPSGRTMQLRRLRPSEIEDDPEIQIVLFKSSLNVGWDCPRAEVMMSFRKANDPTNIAQLVGRMVRTPLARRIQENDHLNSVTLYLPHYNPVELKAIVAYLTESGEAAAASEIETHQPVTLSRAPGTEAIFTALEGITNYVLPTARKTTQIRRLLRLARQLAIDELDLDAEVREKNTLVGLFDAEREALEDDQGFKAVINERGQVEMQQVEWQIYATALEEQPTVCVPASRENIEDLFSAAGRKLGEGLHLAYVKSRAKTGVVSVLTAKLEVIALAWRSEVQTRIEEAARLRVAELLGSHDSAIKGLSEP
jgi:type III restriction enzyme